MRSTGSIVAAAPPEVVALAAMLPAGMHVAAVAPDQAGIASLHPLEALLTADDSAERRQQFIAGRACAHHILTALAQSPAPLLRRRDGAPDWPRTVRGSISHKPDLCLAIAARATDVAGIGVDLEVHRALPAPVWARVFTAAELRRLHVLTPAARVIRARLCFSAKECYYKWYRSQGGYQQPDFDDVEVEITGTSLRVQPTPGSGLPAVEGCFAQGDTWLITALWSYAANPADSFLASSQVKNSLEVDHHGYTHRSPVHA